MVDTEGLSFGKLDESVLGFSGPWMRPKGPVGSSVVCGDVPLLRLDETLLTEYLLARLLS